MGNTPTPFGYRRINIVDGQVVYPDEKFYQRVYERYIPEMIARNELPLNRGRYSRYAQSGQCGPNCNICNRGCGPDCDICNSRCDDYDSCAPDYCDLDCDDCHPRYRSRKRRDVNFNQTNVYKFSHSGSFPNGLF